MVNGAGLGRSSPVDRASLGYGRPVVDGRAIGFDTKTSARKPAGRTADIHPFVRPYKCHPSHPVHPVGTPCSPGEW